MCIGAIVPVFLFTCATVYFGDCVTVCPGDCAIVSLEFVLS